LWRGACSGETGEDKEALKKLTAMITGADQNVIDTPREMIIKDEDGNTKKVKCVLERLVSRKKVKKGHMYEVVQLLHGPQHVVPGADAREVGLHQAPQGARPVPRNASPRRRARPLTTRNITEHHNCIGLEPEQLEPQPCATSAAASRPRSSCWRPAPRPART
jgi:hypothetical protein